jgi:HAD superfamily hydrolase (TIGR01509 family)
MRQPLPAGCLFDLDGLLLDTEPLHSRAWSESIRYFGAIAPTSLLEELRGRDRFDNAATVIEKLELKITVKDLLNIQQPISQSLVANAMPIIGAPELIKRCKEKNIPMAIATSSGREAVLVKIKPHPWLKQIEVRVCGDDLFIKNAKPAPDLFIEAAKKLGLKPEECWAFEDSPAGSIAAKTAGCRVFVLPASGLQKKDYPDGVEIIKKLEDVPI